MSSPPEKSLKHYDSTMLFIGMLKVITGLESMAYLLIGRGLGSDFDLGKNVIIVFLLIFVAFLLFYCDFNS